MNPLTIESANVRLQELLAQDAAHREEIDRCLREISRLRGEHRKAIESMTAAQEESARRLTLARRAADALIEKAQAEAKKSLFEAEEVHDLAIKTAKAPVAGLDAAMRALDEERQLYGERRAEARTEYNTLSSWLATAKAEAERVAQPLANETTTVPEGGVR